MNKFHSIICFASLAAILLTGCVGKVETEKPRKVIPVKTTTVSGTDAAYKRNYVGVAEESFAISLSFSLSGIVERVAVAEGQKVKKGQLLATLNSATMQNAYNISQSTLKQAQDAYNRIASLHEKGSITDIKFVEVETALEQAKAMEAISKKNLEDTKLYAPSAGIIAKRSLEEGSNVMPGMAAFKLVSINEIDVKISVPENEIGSIAIGQPATVTVPAAGNAQYEGVVDKKGVEANSITHTYDIRVRVKNPLEQLMPGMVCKAYLSGCSEQPRFIIPNKAVQINAEGKHFVWLADGSIAKRAFVTIGQLTDFGITVESGLSEGDRVITDGSEKVSEGMQISVTQ